MNINRQRLYDVIESRLIKHSSRHSVPFDLSLALRLLSQVIFNEPTKGCYRKGSIHDWDELPHSKSLFYASSGCGLPIGNLTSQLFSNIYLSRLDDFVKRELKLRHYGRYVDDFYIVGYCKEELLAAIPVIRNFLSREHIDKVLVGEHNPYVIKSVIQSYAGYQKHFMSYTKAILPGYSVL